MSGVLPGIWQEQMFNICQACPPSRARRGRSTGCQKQELGRLGLPVRLRAGLRGGRGQQCRRLESSPARLACGLGLT